MQEQDMRKRFAPALLAAALLAACGDSTGSQDYENVQGVYDVGAPLNEIAGARFSGTLTIIDDSRSTPEFSGTYALRLLGPDGATAGNYSGDIKDGEVTKTGSLKFNLQNDGFRWSGVMSGTGDISGTWILVGESQANYTGSFLADRR
jgi:hypothetical protein